MRSFHTSEGLNEHTSKKATAPRERTKLACDQCRNRKLKCDEQRPCQGCHTRQLPCIVSSLSRGPGRPRNDDTRTTIHAGTDFNMLDDPEPSTLWPSGHTGSPTTESTTYLNTTDNSGFYLPGTTGTSLSATTVASQAQQQTRSNVHIGPVPDFDASFSTSNALALDEAVNVGQRWEDMDFMDGIWDLPELVRRTYTFPNPNFAYNGRRWKRGFKTVMRRHRVTAHGSRKGLRRMTPRWIMLLVSW
jgi:hypothetical protein